MLSDTIYLSKSVVVKFAFLFCVGCYAIATYLKYVIE